MTQARRPFIAGNWKMFNTIAASRALARAVADGLRGFDGADVALCPPMTSILPVVEALRGTRIAVGAQDVYWEAEGAFTGEVSPAMLRDAGCGCVIIAHSERRQFFGETNAGAAKKIRAALAPGLRVIYCVGEKLEEREAGKTEAVVEDHVRGGLSGLAAADMKNVVIAYEPVWAIGTGRTATPEQAEDAHRFIRGVLGEMFGGGVAAAAIIQYGGSVKPENVNGLMSQADIDGALVGGASLKADSFLKIVKYKEA